MYRRFMKTGILLAILLIWSHKEIIAQGYPPKEAAEKMSPLPGFQVELIASEPQVRQPVAIDFDDRGRLWVLQYLQYPNPAGLKRVKVDRYSRTTYDRVPKPPPLGPKGADRLTILEDRDGDGLCESSKDFINGLNLSTGFAFGNGGVFVLQVPYLLFYPDQNGDDIPDTDPKVLLKGFGMEDSSSLANSLIFGPDGWLYGTQGTNIMANIRGIEFEQGVWRYHMPTDRFELFCEGGGNSWGLDFDQEGNLLYATNHGGYLMHHGVQGAYYEKAFAKHGELHNPFAFGYFPHVPNKKFKGGHVTVGGFVYESDEFPNKYRGKYVAVDTLGHAVHYHSIIPRGSTFRTEYAGTFVEANDNWFAPSDGVQAPDGSIYFCDWHDQRTAHPDPDAEWDRRNGRIYRLSYRRSHAQKPANPRQLSSRILINWLSSPNEWKVRRARRVLAERNDLSLVPALSGMINSSNLKVRREAFWTLAGMGYFEKNLPLSLLGHQDEVIRSWAIRILGDAVFHAEKKNDYPEESYRNKMIHLAKNETSPRVLSQIACTAKRLNGYTAIPVIMALARREELLKDPYIPLLVWWALEEHAMPERNEILASFTTEEFQNEQLVKDVLISRLLKRLTGDGSDEGFRAAAELLSSINDPSEKMRLLADFDDGLKMIGKKRLEGLPLTGYFDAVAVKRIERTDQPKAINKIPPELSGELQKIWKKEPNHSLLLRILIRLGDSQARNHALKLVSDPKTPMPLRLELLTIFEELAREDSIETFLSLLENKNSEVLNLAILQVLRRLSDPRITRQLLALYANSSPEMQKTIRDILLSRKESAFEFLKQVDATLIDPKDVSSDQLQILALHDDSRINSLVQKHWGRISAGTPEEKLAEIRRISNDLRADVGDYENGKKLFVKHCATCHQMFGQGNKIGPDLTQANRNDQLYLLTSLVDPNAQIRKEYLKYNLATTDGRIVIGLLKEETENSLTLVTEKNELVKISRDEVDEFAAATTSLMPENLLKQLKPQELRDLFEYLKSARE